MIQRGLFYLRLRRSVALFRLNESGQSLVLILGFVAIVIAAGVGLYNYALQSRYADLNTRTILSQTTLSDGIMDYVSMSVKSQWCLTQQWQEDTAVDCKEKEFTHASSIRRLIASLSEIQRRGENFLVQARKGRITNDTVLPLIAGNPALVALFSAEKIPNTQPEFHAWLNEWVNLIQIDRIEMDIPLTLDEIANNHPIRPLIEINRAYYEKKGFKRAHILLKRSNPIDTPSYGREVNLDLTMTIIQVAPRQDIAAEGDGSSPGADGSVTATTGTPSEVITKETVYRSAITATPVELNRFSLLSAGDLHLESDSAPSNTSKGTFIANNLSKDAKPVGIHFDSPVMFSQRIILPSADTIEALKHNAASTAAIIPNVYFSNGLFLGFDKNSLKGQTTEEALSMDELCSREEGTNGSSVAGAICQGDGVFKPSNTNKLIHSKIMLRDQVGWLDYDKGLDYIAGPTLNGLADGNQAGEVMATCADLSKARTDMQWTQDSRLKVFRINPTESPVKTVFYWENTAETTQTYNIKNLNRFQIPGSDKPRGEFAQCFSKKNAKDDWITPQIYGLASQAVTKRTWVEDHYVIEKGPSFEIEEEQTPITPPVLDYFNDQGAELGVCPKKKELQQYDVLKNDFANKAKVIVNFEYYLQVADRDNALGSLNDFKLNIATSEDSIQSPLIHSSRADLKLPRANSGRTRFGFRDLIFEIETRVSDFLDSDNGSGNLGGSLNKERCGTSSNGEAPTLDGAKMVYCAKALMGINTKLKRNEDSTTLKIKVLLQEFKVLLQAMTAWRIGATCSGASCDGNLAGDRTDDLLDNGEKKSIRYQIGKGVLDRLTDTEKVSKHYKDALSNASYSENYHGHDEARNTAVLKYLTDKLAEFDAVIAKDYQPNITLEKGNYDTAKAAADNCTSVEACAADPTQMCRSKDCSDKDAAVGPAYQKYRDEVDKLTAYKTSVDYDRLVLDITYLNDLYTEKNNRITNLNKMETATMAILDDLIELVSDISINEVASKSELDLQMNFGTATNPSLKSIFHPSAFILDGGVPRKRADGTINQFVRYFYLKINGFDPSSKYQEIKLKGQFTPAYCAIKDNWPRCESECNKGEKDDPTKTAVRAWITVPDTTHKKCVEFSSERPRNADGKFLGNYNNWFSVTITASNNNKTGTQELEPATETLVEDQGSNNAYYTALIPKSKEKHLGFYEFACAMVSTFINKVGTANTEEAVEMAINGGFNEPAILSQSFTDQTNHSWYFAPVNVFNHFFQVKEISYAISNNNDENLNITTNSNPLFAPLQTPQQLESDQIENQVDSYLGDAFSTYSIASTCTIRKEVTNFTGNLVCRNFVIEDGRTQRLDIIGTIIAGRVVIPASAVQHGVFFKTIYHPESQRYLVDTVENCNLAIDENPTWFRPQVSSTDPGRTGKLAALSECSVARYRDKAQPLTWSKVDPDCGLMGQFNSAVQAGVPQYSERMMCKDDVENYFVSEKWRSTPE